MNLPSLLVRGILDSSDGAISFVQTVLALHDVTITILVLVLLVTGVRVFYFVLILVFGMSLE